MALFKRGKNEDKKATKPPARESSPQKVGVVSGVLSTTADSDPEAQSLFSDVVARRFGPEDEARDTRASGDPGRVEGENGDGGNGEGNDRLPPRYAAGGTIEDRPRDSVDSNANAETQHATAAAPRPEHLRAVESVLSNAPGYPELEVDPMAHIGRTTLITGDVVAEEDLEIQGTIEGSVRLPNHQVTVGVEGHVKATVEAKTVHVMGRITGNVVATDLIEVEAGGIVGGDVKAPRVIMHDGAIVVGGLDMSASLPNAAKKDETSSAADPAPERPLLKKVEAPAAQREESPAAAQSDELNA